MLVEFLFINSSHLEIIKSVHTIGNFFGKYSYKGLVQENNFSDLRANFLFQQHSSLT